MQLTNREIALITDALTQKMESLVSQIIRLTDNDDYRFKLESEYNEIFRLRTRLRSILELDSPLNG